MLHSEREESRDSSVSKYEISAATGNAATGNTSAQQNRKPCVLCNQNHGLMRCPDLNILKVPQRLEFVNSCKLCHNCFRDNQKLRTAEIQIVASVVEGFIQL